MKKPIAVLVVVFLAVLIVPVLITQLTKPAPRELQGVRLADLTEDDYQEISFQNAEQGLQLAGMMFAPEGEGPFPAAVIIHGSGTSHRDHRWYLTLARHLQDNGIVVLLPDKRGSEKSQGDWRTASLDDLAIDTIAAVGYLKDQHDVPITRIGVIGLSQGGMIAPLVASKSVDIDFVVNMVGGAEPMHDILVYEENNNLREIGFLPGVSNLIAYPSVWSIIYMRQKGFWDAVGNFNAAPYWDAMTVPSLILLGEDDKNVPSGRTAAVLESLDNPNIEVKIYEGSGHGLETPEGQGNAYIREDALSDMVDFVLSATRSP